MNQCRDMVSNMPFLRYVYLLLLLTFPVSANGAEYHCAVGKKFDSEREYPPAYIAQWQFSAHVEETLQGTYISRYSFCSSVQNVTCDRYMVDRVEFNKYVKIKKFYVFRSQLDFQLFPDLSFVENNGRGGIAYGKCHLVSP
jgi:hypothetical protein